MADDVPPGYEDVPPGFEDVDVPPGYVEDQAAATAEPGAALDGIPANGDAQASGNLYQSDLTFQDLELAPAILDALILDLKFERPSKIQALTLPQILKQPDRHMIAQGHNGCGKTTCFTLAMLMRVNAELNRPQAMCICPTRELVIQNTSVLQKMAARTQPQILVRNTAEMEERVRGQRPPPITEHVIIGTPGTLEGWISRRRLPLDSMRALVFDEADVMLMTEGFKDVSFRMLSSIRKVSPDVQILLFSATFNDRVRDYCNKIVPGATRVLIQKEDLSLDVIRQHKVFVQGPGHKAEILKRYILANADRLGQMIVFVRTRHGADQLTQAMLAEGYHCSLLSGEMERQARDLVVQQFRDMQTRILIATDVLSRGFDVSTVTLVVNYDLPVKHDTCDPDFETYLHRIGRSGRFGNKGVAFNFVDPSFRHRNNASDADIMAQIEMYFDRQVQELPADDEDAFIAALEDAGLMVKTD